MNYRKNKMERLSKVAHMYYEEDRTQGEIADALQVSRPLVSRMLREARELGIIEIRVHQPEYDAGALLSRLCKQYGLQGGELIAEEESESLIDYNLVKRLLQFIEAERPETLGVGWGAMIGTLTTMIERMPPHRQAVRTVCPLIGNSSVSSRQYHSDENVRIIAVGLRAQPQFIYLPAFPADETEYDLLRRTRSYRAVAEQWDHLDVALVGIHETTAARDVNLPRQNDVLTAGHMVAYSFDVNGRIIRPDSACMIHIPLDKLAQCRRVIGLCAADVSPRTLVGALRTGLLTHIFVRETLADAVMADEWLYA